jgi:putative ABC transport system permease protein
VIGVMARHRPGQGRYWAISFPSEVEIWSIAISLFVSTAVGLFFGVYPAHKAAQLDPITALRAEL